jgi:putative membrane protein
MVAKLIGVVLLLAWHLYLVAERRKILAGTSVRTSKFWRMTNEIPFVIAVVMVLSVTTQWTFG